jgi:hypothetical protein
MRVKLPGGLSDKQVEGVERAIKSCPAYGTLLHPVAVEIALEVEPGHVAAKVPLTPARVSSASIDS